MRYMRYEPLFKQGWQLFPIQTSAHRKWSFLRFLYLQRWGLVSMLGLDSPALFTAMNLNWYHFPKLRPGTRDSSCSMVAEQLALSVTRASNQPPNESFFWMM